jgi:hypothetical protein
MPFFYPYLQHPQAVTFDGVAKLAAQAAGKGACGVDVDGHMIFILYTCVFACVYLIYGWPTRVWMCVYLFMGGWLCNGYIIHVCMYVGIYGWMDGHIIRRCCTYVAIYGWMVSYIIHVYAHGAENLDRSSSRRADELTNVISRLSSPSLPLRPSLSGFPLSHTHTHLYIYTHNLPNNPRAPHPSSFI